MPYERDILTHVVLKKEPVNTAFACVRRSATDLPVLNMSAAKAGESLRIVAGSRQNVRSVLPCPGVRIRK